MSTPAAHDAEEFLRRVFPEPAPDGADDAADDSAEDDAAALRADPTSGGGAPVRGVDERRQQLLEPIGDPDRESW